MDSDVFFLSKVLQLVDKGVSCKGVYDRMSEFQHICDHDVVWHTSFFFNRDVEVNNLESL